MEIFTPFGSGAGIPPADFKIYSAGKKSLRVAAYIRVSTDSSDQENSYETQERYFNRLLLHNSAWISAGIYSDYGLSGTDEEKRTGFRRILRHCREGKIDRIICKAISRFARNTADFMTALQTLHESGTSIFFEKENLDTADPASDFIWTMLGAIAQEESRSISGNIRWGVQKRFPMGDVANRPLYGYRYNDRLVTSKTGYRYRDIEIVEEEAKVVRRIFCLAADGERYAEIARRLNFEQIPAPESNYIRRRKLHPEKGQLYREKDEGWTARHISQILHSERYAGNVLAQKTYTTDYLSHKTKRNKGELTQYLVRNHHPAIIDSELYETSRKILEINAAIYGPDRRRRKKRAFSGRLVCGECGRFYHTRNTRRHPIWFCPSSALNNGREVCHAERIYEEQIVRMFRKAILERFQLAIPKEREAQAEEEGDGSGRNEEAFSFSYRADGFVSFMRSRLEILQKMDYVERDRLFLKRQIAAARMGNERRRKNIIRLQEQDAYGKISFEKDSTHHFFPDNLLENVRLQEEEARLREGEAEERKLSERLEYLESYWEELEDDYECRNRAIRWMEGLPEGKEGTAALLNGLTDEYARAFALSITVHSPFHYTIRWFDDTRTETVLDSNVEDHRRRACRKRKEYEERAEIRGVTSAKKGEKRDVTEDKKERVY